MDYKIFSLEEENYDIILLTTIEDPYFILTDIYDAYLANGKSRFSVVLDLFLRNGYSFNRFALIEFTSKDEYTTKVINARVVSEKAKLQIKYFLSKNENLLLDSSLSSRIIDFVLSA